MTAVDRAALIARAKSLAVPVANCTAAGIPPSHLIGDATWHELYALVLVLADGADLRRLKAACSARDAEYTPAEVRRLRRAHAEARKLRREGLPRPLQLRVAEGEYRAWLAAKAAGGEAVPPARRPAA